MTMTDFTKNRKLWLGLTVVLVLLIAVQGQSLPGMQ